MVINKSICLEGRRVVCVFLFPLDDNGDDGNIRLLVMVVVTVVPNRMMAMILICHPRDDIVSSLS